MSNNYVLELMVRTLDTNGRVRSRIAEVEVDQPGDLKTMGYYDIKGLSEGRGVWVYLPDVYAKSAPAARERQVTVIKVSPLKVMMPAPYTYKVAEPTVVVAAGEVKVGYTTYIPE